jgi:uncharacterized protein YndB with AHSA1/START domain
MVGPKNFTSPTAMIDLREGGKYLLDMRGPDGTDFWNGGVYRVVTPDRLVMVDSFTDSEGNPVPASTYGLSDDYPMETIMTVTFVETVGRTNLTISHPKAEGVDYADETAGWNESLDKLSDSLMAMKQTSVR